MGGMTALVSALGSEPTWTARVPNPWICFFVLIPLVWPLETTTGESRTGLIMDGWVDEKECRMTSHTRLFNRRQITSE